MTNSPEKTARNEGDRGPEKIYQFLSRAGFLEAAADAGTLRAWFGKLDYERFEDHLARLNGLARTKERVFKKDRGFVGPGVTLGNAAGIGYIPPQEKDEKRALLKEAFTVAKTLPARDAGLLLYYAIQAIHPFSDGNGRVGRLLYLLFERAETGGIITEHELEDFLRQDEEVSPGRKKFEKNVERPEYARIDIGRVLVRDLLGDDQALPFADTYSGLTYGSARIENGKLTPETKAALELVMSESLPGGFPYRTLVMLKYLRDHGLRDEYVREKAASKPGGHPTFRLDATRLLADVSEEQARELVALARQIKKQSVEALIDVFARPDEYKTRDGKRLKDTFYRA